MLKGFWNYSEPIQYSVIEYEVTKIDETPLHWQNSHVGQIRQGLRVVTESTKSRPTPKTFIIDNQHGDGYYKIFSTKGSPGAGHKSVSNPINIKELYDGQIITKYDFAALKAEENLHDEYAEKVDPETFKKIKSLREGIIKNRKDNPDAFK